MKLIIETVNKVDVQDQILAKKLASAEEVLKSDLERKLKQIFN